MDKQTVLYMSVCVLSHSVVPNSCEPIVSSLPGSSVHRILQATKLECVAIFPSRIFPSQESNPGPLHCRQTLYQLSYEGSPLSYGGNPSYIHTKEYY